jgi:hypothetical protein
VRGSLEASLGTATRLSDCRLKADRENVNDAFPTNGTHVRTEYAEHSASLGWGRSCGSRTMETTAKPPWKVGATEKTVSGRNWRHGFGFSIQDSRVLSHLVV